MSGQDQASGLRKWANLQRQQQQTEDAVDVAAAEHVSEHASPLLSPTVKTVEETTILAPPRPKIPLIVVGLPPMVQPR